jgi:hypothetical protein
MTKAKGLTPKTKRALCFFRQFRIKNCSLMDRCCGLVHCMAFEGKYGASVVTSAGGDEAPDASPQGRWAL